MTKRTTGMTAHSPDTANDTETTDLPASLKLLRAMVMTLTAVMIVGVVTVVLLLVMRLGNDTPPLPETLALPDGVRPTAVTQGSDWVGIVTDRDEILIYDRMTGALRQQILITKPEPE